MTPLDHRITRFDSPWGWDVSGVTAPEQDRTFPLGAPRVIPATATLRIPASSNAQASDWWNACAVGRRCLIVDDNALYLREARRLLKRQGLSIVGVASNCADALAVAESDRPDVALVDVDLGAESGLDVARALAACDEPVPVILISAYAENDLRELLDDSPAVGFLAKSVLSRAAIDDLLGDRNENRGP